MNISVLLIFTGNASTKKVGEWLKDEEYEREEAQVHDGYEMKTTEATNGA